jgi:hypothetical protein
MRATELVTRRSALGILGTALLFAVCPRSAVAAPLNVAVTTKEAGSHVQVGIRVSVHAGPVNFDNFNLGMVYVPKGGKRVLEAANPVGAIVQAVISIQGVVATVAVTVKAAGAVIASQTVKKTI